MFEKVLAVTLFAAYIVPRSSLAQGPLTHCSTFPPSLFTSQRTLMTEYGRAFDGARIAVCGGTGGAGRDFGGAGPRATATYGAKRQSLPRRLGPRTQILPQLLPFSGFLTAFSNY